MPFPERNTNSYTGFVAHYTNGRVVYERENYDSKKLKKKCATNWAEIDRNKLVAMEMFWHGQLKARIEKDPSSDPNRKNILGPSEWFFSQKGYFDMGTRKITVVARNIGYVQDGIIHITSVVEKTGTVQMYDRAL